MRRTPCGGCRPTGCSGSPTARAPAELSVSPAMGRRPVAPEIDNVRARSTGRPNTTPSAVSPWPRRWRGSGSFVSRSRARHVSNTCSHEPRTPSRSFAPAPCGVSAVRSSSPAYRTRRACLPAEPRALHRERRRDPDREPPISRRGEPGRPGRGAAAWPLLEDSLVRSGSIGLRRGEAQALAYLAEKPREDGDLARAIELTLESAAIAGEVDWAWWQFLQLFGAAAARTRAREFRCRRRSRRRLARASLGLGNRQAHHARAAELAVIAAERGDAERAGGFGALSRATRAPGRSAGGSDSRQDVEALVLRADGPAFARGANGGPPAIDRRRGRPRLAPAGLTRVTGH